MHNIDPNDMDALFREGAEKHEFTYNPEAWAMMEEKLDTRKRRRYFFLWFILGAILIAGIASIYLFTNSDEQPNSIVTNSNIETTNKSVYQENSIGVEVKTDSNLESKISESHKIDDIEIVNNSDNNQLENNKVTSSIAHVNTTEQKEEYINTVSKVRGSYIGAQNSFQSENTGSLVDNEVVSVSSQFEINATKNNSNSSNLDNEPNQLKDNEIVDSKVIQSKNSRDLLILDALNIKNIDQVKMENLQEFNFDLQPKPYFNVISSTRNLRYVLTSFGSCDFSSVGFYNDVQSGFTLGAKVGVQLARKFQFDIGFAYSLKKYGSEGLDYNLEGGWTTMTGVSPSWMDGKGNILQIPMEVSYYFNGYDHDGFFANVGISTYIFNSEWYGFKYDPEDLLINPNAIVEITNEEISRRNFHPAGLARVSFGYQKIVSPNMAFELSPYLQIPLTGIGEGKVDLYTAGLQFAVKFNTK